MDVTLNSLLAKVSQNLPVMTYISTCNQTFPKEYRFSKEFPWELQQKLPGRILSLSVKSINGNKETLRAIMMDKYVPKGSPTCLLVEIYDFNN